MTLQLTVRPTYHSCRRQRRAFSGVRVKYQSNLAICTSLATFPSRNQARETVAVLMLPLLHPSGSNTIGAVRAFLTHHPDQATVLG